MAYVGLTQPRGRPCAGDAGHRRARGCSQRRRRQRVLPTKPNTLPWCLLRHRWPRLCRATPGAQDSTRLALALRATVGGVVHRMGNPACGSTMSPVVQRRAGRHGHITRARVVRRGRKQHAPRALEDPAAAAQRSMPGAQPDTRRQICGSNSGGSTSQNRFEHHRPFIAGEGGAS